RDDLLTLRRKGDNAQVDLVAARLLIVGDDLLQCHILVLHEALRPPHGRGRRRRIGDIGTRDTSSRGKSQGTAEERTSSEISHDRLLPVSTHFDPLHTPTLGTSFPG